MTDIVERLQALARFEHDDKSIGAEAAAEILRLRSELEAAKKDAGWRPIDTAPKDGTWIMITRECADEAYVAKWAEYPGNPVAGADGAEDVYMWGWLLRDPLAYPGGMEDGFLGWEEDADHMPTRWMPLPPAPAIDAEMAKG